MFYTFSDYMERCLVLIFINLVWRLGKSFYLILIAKKTFIERWTPFWLVVTRYGVAL